MIAIALKLNNPSDSRASCDIEYIRNMIPAYADKKSDTTPYYAHSYRRPSQDNINVWCIPDADHEDIFFNDELGNDDRNYVVVINKNDLTMSSVSSYVKVLEKLGSYALVIVGTHSDESVLAWMK